MARRAISAAGFGAIRRRNARRAGLVALAGLALLAQASLAPAVTERGTDGPDTLVGTPERDTLNGRGGDDELAGLGSRDTLRGARGSDVVRGGRGGDLLRGGGGRDGLNMRDGVQLSSPGDDEIRARDGFRDQINCGTGDDVAYVDQVEDGVYDCETVIEP